VEPSCRAVDTQWSLGGYLCQCRSLHTGSFEKTQDPGPHENEKSNPDPHYSEKEEPDPHQIEKADPEFRIHAKEMQIRNTGCTVGGFKVSNLMGIKRRMIDIREKKLFMGIFKDGINAFEISQKFYVF
jgi:hypothetical protein